MYLVSQYYYIIIKYTVYEIRLVNFVNVTRVGFSVKSAGERPGGSECPQFESWSGHNFPHVT